MNLPERIEKVIRDWPQWSRAERAKMPQLVEEIMDHVRNGTGNGFGHFRGVGKDAPDDPAGLFTETIGTITARAS